MSRELTVREFKFMNVVDIKLPRIQMIREGVPDILVANTFIEPENIDQIQAKRAVIYLSWEPSRIKTMPQIQAILSKAKYIVSWTPHDVPAKWFPSYAIRDWFDPVQVMQRRSVNQRRAKEKFCVTFITSEWGEERNRFFDRLLRYKAFDSCGKYRQNLESHIDRVDHVSIRQVDFLSQYRFVFCFENCCEPHYLTEKIVNAYRAGSIPIYFGDPHVGDVFNLKSMVHVPNVDAFDQAIARIDQIEQDPSLYHAIQAEPMFVPGLNPYSLPRYSDQINSIIKEIL